MTNNNIYFIANWKMYGDLSSVNSIKKVISLKKQKKFKQAKIIYCPPNIIMNEFIKYTKYTNISVSSQDCYFIDGTGPYTGNISAYQLKKLGVDYVIAGHSEKRLDGDTDKVINKKVINILSNNLQVILCVGESLKEKKNKKTLAVIRKQLSTCLKKVKKSHKIIIAYEPIWSIGSGIIPSPKELDKTIKYINQFLSKKFKNNKSKILYGGSVNQKNINILKNTKGIDGFLIGGASQTPNKFIDIIKKTIN